MLWNILLFYEQIHIDIHANFDNLDFNFHQSIFINVLFSCWKQYSLVRLSYTGLIRIVLHIYSASEVSESLSADVWQHCAQVTPAVYHGPRWLIIQNRGEEWPGIRLTLDCVKALSGVRVTAGLGLLKLRFWPTEASTVAFRVFA